MLNAQNLTHQATNKQGSTRLFFACSFATSRSKTRGTLRDTCAPQDGAATHEVSCQNPKKHSCCSFFCCCPFLCFFCCFSACLMCFGSLPSVSEAARARRGGRGAVRPPLDSFLVHICLLQTTENQNQLTRKNDNGTFNIQD